MNKYIYMSSSASASNFSFFLNMDSDFNALGIIKLSKSLNIINIRRGKEMSLLNNYYILSTLMYILGQKFGFYVRSVD